MRKSKIVIGVAVLAIGLGYVFQDTIQTRMYAFMHSSMHDRHSADGMGHDMKNMPGLRGANASESESDELAVMFENFETISREVTNLPNGIRTVTRSSDEDVMAVLVSHIVGMVDRVARGDDPKIFIQSPTLDILFANGAEMQSQIDVTEEGIVVVRTSTDPDVVAALHKHAAEVSDMADRGMQAVHDAMAQRADN
ncbi:hypothetical protein [Sulfitobacter sp.]|uniref:hypothetical protein n=1 Tax=Sulfitobacter sp. TaxID=1903071 RepID=UPI00300191BC